MNISKTRTKISIFRCNTAFHLNVFKIGIRRVDLFFINEARNYIINLPEKHKPMNQDFQLMYRQDLILNLKYIKLIDGYLSRVKKISYVIKPLRSNTG